MRGTVRKPLISVVRPGIIPACAGNRRERAKICSGAWDHPRVCGEQTVKYKVAQDYKGSSPRVRGTGFARSSAQDGRGIIPACAGNSCFSIIHKSNAGDHPRVCGEQFPDKEQSVISPGSSPRVRGTDWFFFDDAGHMGIIPACAGNRRPKQKALYPRRDHPRVCGEQTKDPQLNITHPS